MTPKNNSSLSPPIGRRMKNNNPGSPTRKMRPSIREPGSPTKSIDPKLGAPRKTAGMQILDRPNFRYGINQVTSLKHYGQIVLPFWQFFTKSGILALFCHFGYFLTFFGIRKTGSPTKSMDPKLGAPRKTAGSM